MYAGEQLVASDGYEVALYPMTSAKITQSRNGSTSHRCSGISNTGLWDVVGESGAVNQSNIYAPFSGTITVQKADGHQRVLSSSDKVHLANGTLQYANFGWGHDNQLLVNLGDYVTQGQLIGYTGTYTNVSRHSHWMLGTGQWTRGNSLPKCPSTGYWYMPNAIDIDDMFYVNDTQVVTFYIDGLTLDWKTWNQPQPSTVTITTSVSPSGAGTVTGGGTYPYGANVTLTATPNSGHTFIQWSSGQTSLSITITANSSKNYTAYFDNPPPTPPTPTPEAKVMTVVPESTTLFVPKEGNSFRIDFDMTGTPDGSQWLWYPDIALSSPNISIDSLNANYWYYTSYIGADGNPYIETTAQLQCIIPWSRTLSGTSATYTINFSRWNSSWTQCDLSKTITVYVTYAEGGAVLFLRYDGGAVEIR